MRRKLWRWFERFVLRRITYTCAICGNTYWSPKEADDEARAERLKLFGSPVTDEDGVVCEDCWPRVRPLLTHTNGTAEVDDAS